MPNMYQQMQPMPSPWLGMQPQGAPTPVDATQYGAGQMSRDAQLGTSQGMQGLQMGMNNAQASNNLGMGQLGQDRDMAVQGMTPQAPPRSMGDLTGQVQGMGNQLKNSLQGKAGGFGQVFGDMKNQFGGSRDALAGGFDKFKGSFKNPFGG